MNKRYWTLGHRLPSFLANPLFGDRCRFGLEIQNDDSDWHEWQGFYLEFYNNTQKNGFGKKVNDAGYEILRRVDLTDKHVLEVGPGSLPHRRFWHGKPAIYAIVDIKQQFVDQSVQILRQECVATSSFVLSADFLPLDDASIDIIISFYSLEHMYPLKNYLKEFRRVLRPGGLLVGAIPCEGGLAWGGGRFITSRQYIKKNSSINPDKIICWEHPNFAEQILQSLSCHFELVHIHFWPLRLPLIDLNLVCHFVYRKGCRVVESQSNATKYGVPEKQHLFCIP
jgi:SAM-dependent methyltransferase